MVIGILKETSEHESRVSITPDVAKKLISTNHKIHIESGAGVKSFFSDEDYSDVGCIIENNSKSIYNCELILKVNAFSKEELEYSNSENTLICFFQIRDNVNTLPDYINKKITLLSMSHIPRTTLAQNMDALSSQSNISGYKSTIIAADHASKYMPLLMTAAGTIKPAKALILGAGVAGLAAIANTKRMGAQVFAFDVRPIVKEQVESLGAKFIEVESDIDEGTGEGGYAKEVSEKYKKKQGLLIEETIKNMDIVISTALIPERKAPILINKKMVESMRPGSVIMDLAAQNGGNCELTKCDHIITYNNITIDGRSNLPSTMAKDASQLYAKNVYNFLSHLYKEDDNQLNLEDEITSGSMLLNNGEVCNDIVKQFLDKG
jgi:NAD(P) transhydrogenase subunit alpha